MIQMMLPLNSPSRREVWAMACQCRKESQGDILLATERGSSCSYDGKSSNCPVPWSPGRSPWSRCQGHVASTRWVSAPSGNSQDSKAGKDSFYRICILGKFPARPGTFMSQGMPASPSSSLAETFLLMSLEWGTKSREKEREDSALWAGIPEAWGAGFKGTPGWPQPSLVHVPPERAPKRAFRAKGSGPSALYKL